MANQVGTARGAPTSSARLGIGLSKLQALFEVADDEDPMHQLLGDSISCRISAGPQRGREIFTLQTLPPCEHEDRLSGLLGQVAGSSLAKLGWL